MYLKTKNDIKTGEVITPKVIASHTLSGFKAANLCNGFGISKTSQGLDVHDNHPKGATMWCAQPGDDDELWIQFDFERVYPIGEMDVWNYNRYDPSTPNISYTNQGLKNIRIFHSIDKLNWIELKGPGYPYQLAKAGGVNQCAATNLNDGNNTPIDFDGVSARYIKICINSCPNDGNWGGINGNECIFGLSEIQFHLGKGIAVDTADEWTNLFKRQSGWVGADASYSVPCSGIDKPGSGAQSNTIFLFGDTFIGEIDHMTARRSDDTIMLNNTIGILRGNRPDRRNMNFIWGENGSSNLNSVFIPEGNDGYYYWPQDGVCIDNNLYVFALKARQDLTGPEGFQFAVDAVDLVSIPLGINGPVFEKQKHMQTPLHFSTKESGEIFFGGSIMLNTSEAGAPDPDGYAYIYGWRNNPVGRELLVARIIPENIENFEKWRFWDGMSWSDNIADCKAVFNGVSCEFSVTPVYGGMFENKFVLVCQKDGIGQTVAYSAGQTPVGPFEKAVPIYYCPEPDSGESIYVYNAKAHPHLSQKGELLVSYNVNSTSMEAHMNNGYIYRTRWIRLYSIK
ncbi:discoidin domain-containing protein [Mahella australiensis]|nr:discoidin domain-containing protein [Mahella australiensis]